MASNYVKSEVVQESEITTEAATDACSNVRVASADVETDRELEITGEITEETIETNFKTYRLYLETHIDVLDLIAYYEPFSQEERRKLYQENQFSREAARLAFNMIEERTQTDKYTQLLFVLDHAGCPKLADLLRGKLVPGNSVNRQRINTVRRHIYERLTPSHILHYLVSWGVITSDEGAKIARKERTESRNNAVLDLLFMLPNRSRDWYTLFLQALVYGEDYTHLADLIDPRKAAQIKAQRLAGMKTHLSDSNTSLQSLGEDQRGTQSYERKGLTEMASNANQHEGDQYETMD